MKSLIFLFLLGINPQLNNANVPFKPNKSAVPFMVYFTSRYRGICSGVLISRVAVLTAAVCVCNPSTIKGDKRPINVHTSAFYRHPRRGVKVQVTKILIPVLPNAEGNRGFLLQISPAILLLKWKVPDILAEVPMRAAHFDIKSEEELKLKEECYTAGWHFFNKGDRIIPKNRFLLQRNLRVQSMNVVQKHLWCETLNLKFQVALEDLGYEGYFNKNEFYCIRDVGLII